MAPSCLLLTAGSAPPRDGGGGFSPCVGAPGGGGFVLDASPPALCFGGLAACGAVLDEAADLEVAAPAAAPVLGVFTMSLSAPATIAGAFALSFHGLFKRIMSSVGLRSNSLSYGGV